MIRNMMVQVVEEQLARELADNAANYPGACHCPQCVCAMQARALNYLPPYYAASMAGKVYSEFHNKEMQNLSDILVAVAKGITETVEEDPYHHMGR